MLQIVTGIVTGISCTGLELQRFALLHCGVTYISSVLCYKHVTCLIEVLYTCNLCGCATCKGFGLHICHLLECGVTHIHNEM